MAIAEFNARATVKSAQGEGEAKKINAEADANVLRTVGEAQAAKTKAVGAAEAEVIRLKIESMEAGNYAVVQVADSELIRHELQLAKSYGSPGVRGKRVGDEWLRRRRC